MNFEKQWARLKGCGIYGSFNFKGTEADWRPTVAEHFRSRTISRPAYGVYIVRQESTHNIIYIGKSGTMKQDGSLKDQDFIKRLVNREKGQRRNIIFGERVVRFGPLLIEYLVLDPKKLVPGYVEARLLQAFYRENGHLPRENSIL
jgi:hypothetical protein